MVSLKFYRAAQKDGVWAWDCELNELVLIIPTVLALLGDNPMQSEFACHIGLRGKFFCRACWVKGSDSAEENEGVGEPPHRRKAPNDSDAESQAASDVGSDVGSDAGSDNSQAPAKDDDLAAPSAEAVEGAREVVTAATNDETPAAEAVGTGAREVEVPRDAGAGPERAKGINSEKGKGRRRKFKETLDQMVQRAKSFVKVFKF